MEPNENNSGTTQTPEQDVLDISNLPILGDNVSVTSNMTEICPEFRSPPPAADETQSPLAQLAVVETQSLLPQPAEEGVLPDDASVISVLEPATIPRTVMMSDEIKRKLAAAQKKHMDAAKLRQKEQVEFRWMDESEDEDADDLSSEEFHHVKEEYERKKAAGSVNMVDEIAFMRLQERYNAKVARQDIELRDAVERAEQPDDESLFLPEARPDKRAFVTCEMDDEGAQPQPKRSRNAIPIDDFDANLVESLQAELNVTKKKRGRPAKASGKTKAPAKPRNRAKGGVAKAGKARKTKHASGIQGSFNQNRLMNPNVFRDIQMNTGRDEQATFTSTLKDQALKELIASIPEEQRSTAHMDKAKVKQATKLFTGHGACKSDGKGGWLVRGMISSLTHYQMIGAAAMRQREVGSIEPRGGLLGDAMGLGKTVMTIANIVNGPPPRGSIRKSTLIVATTSLVVQWMEELFKHAQKQHLGDVIRFVTTLKISAPDVMDMLSKHNVIVTTYSEVARSFPKCNPPADLQTFEERKDWWDRYYEENKGVLHRIEFHRVVLDECQYIKNHKSHRTKACCALTAEHRWALSGTPVQNRLSEFYPFFKFLRVPNIDNLRTFKTNFLMKNGQATERLQVVLNSFMIRRTHEDTLLGSKLLVLPKPTQRKLKCEFSLIERKVYDVVHSRFVDRINCFSQAGELESQYSNIFTMFLRLRQLVDHILLIQDTLRDLLEPEDFDALERIAALPTKEHSTEAAVLQHLRYMLKNRKSLPVVESPGAHLSFPMETSPIPLDGSQQQLTSVVGAPSTSIPTSDETDTTDTIIVDMPTTLDETGYEGSTLEGQPAPSTPKETLDVANAAITIGSDVPIAQEAPITQEAVADNDLTLEKHPVPVASDVSHDFLAGLGLEHIEIEDNPTATATSSGSKNDISEYFQSIRDFKKPKEPVLNCVVCRKKPKDVTVTSCNHIYCYECLLKLSHRASSSGQDRTQCWVCHEYYTTSTTSDSNSAKQVMDSMGAPTDRKKTQAATLKATRAVIDKWVDSEGKMIVSSKMLAIKAQLIEWLEEDPTVKVIVYTQFVAMQYLLSKVCDMQNWGYCLFTGNLKANQRAAVVKDFQEDKTKPIMLASLMAGGVGLNLTMASRVIVVDLWWNSSVEQQAFCRSYRRGQERETELTRFVVKNTIDDYIIRMQERKDAEIGQVISEGPGKDKRISIKEMLQLFGRTGRDGQNNLFIFGRHDPSFVEDDEDEDQPWYADR